jgi:hypothetical protein
VSDPAERDPAALASRLHEKARVAFERRAPRQRGLLRDADELVATCPTGRGPISMSMIFKPARRSSALRRSAGLFVLQSFAVAPDGAECPIGSATATFTATALPHFAEMVAKALDRLVAEDERRHAESVGASGATEPGDGAAGERSSEEGAPQPSVVGS